MRRAAVAGLILLTLSMVAAAMPLPAAADIIWCWDDPVVLIGGRTVSISVGVYDDPLTVMRDVEVAHVTIIVPNGVSTLLVASTNLYFPERVTFVKRGAWTPGQPIPVTVTVTFEARRDLPAALRSVYLSGLLPATAEDSDTTTGKLRTSFTLQ
jgi:hypothetical protein